MSTPQQRLAALNDERERLKKEIKAKESLLRHTQKRIARRQKTKQLIICGTIVEKLFKTTDPRLLNQILADVASYFKAGALEELIVEARISVNEASDIPI